MRRAATTYRAARTLGCLIDSAPRPEPELPYFDVRNPEAVAKPAQAVLEWTTRANYLSAGRPTLTGEMLIFDPQQENGT
jgi:hypothetical protein